MSEQVLLARASADIICVVMTRSSIAGGPVDAVVEEVAKATNMNAGQVLLKWAQQVGDIVVTTSSKVG